MLCLVRAAYRGVRAAQDARPFSEGPGICVIVTVTVLFLLAVLGASPLSGFAQEEHASTPVVTATFTNPLMPPSTPPPMEFAPPPNPAECTIAPRPVADFAPVPVPATPNTGPVTTPTSLEDVPQGQPADAATVAAIEALERQRIACWNANDWPRFLAFYTDVVLRDMLTTYGPDGGADIAADFLASPVPWNWRDWLVVQVRDVRILDNGDVGAIVDTCEQVVFDVYEFEGGRWQIADGFWVEEPPRDYCTYPAFYHGTPVP